MAATIDTQAVKAYLLDLQDRITSATGAVDGKSFATDSWEKPKDSKLQGSGRTCILENGNVLEKGGVGFSHVSGNQLPPAATQNRPEIAGRTFEAMGVSLVFHPRNPKAPTTHMNVRCFIAQAPNQDPVWWFGGGFDLTPYYGVDEDCKHFHQTAKDALDPFGADLYTRFKKWCDEYFYLKHRDEPRGIGGIFFDDFNELGFETSFAMMRSVGDAFIEAYLPILKRRYQEPYTQAERDFQEYRRGRYVEYNLIFDR
jgi:coproporphyrinogen III oxidase